MRFAILFMLVCAVRSDDVKVDVRLLRAREDSPVLRVGFRNRSLYTATEFNPKQTMLVICCQTDDNDDTCFAVSEAPMLYATNVQRTRMIYLYHVLFGGRQEIARIAPADFTPWKLDDPPTRVCWFNLDFAVCPPEDPTPSETPLSNWLTDIKTSISHSPVLYTLLVFIFTFKLHELICCLWGKRNEAIDNDGTFQFPLDEVLRSIDVDVDDVEDTYVTLDIKAETDMSWTKQWDSPWYHIQKVYESVGWTLEEMWKYGAAIQMKEYYTDIGPYLTPSSVNWGRVDGFKQLRDLLRYVPKPQRAKLIDDMITYWETNTGKHTFETVIKCQEGIRWIKIVLSTDKTTSALKCPPCGFRIKLRGGYLQCPEILCHKFTLTDRVYPARARQY